MKEQPESYIDDGGDKFWYLPSKGRNYWHRLDGPAVEGANGLKQWYVDGKRHRLDDPAVEWADGSNFWYVDGKIHRLDGPAIERPNGSKTWWVDGKRHRLDGPAIEDVNGPKYWYVDGRLIFPEEWFEENGIDPDNMCEEDIVAFKLRWL